MTMVRVQEYLSKAEEFLLAAISELRAERSIAATSLTIHAGINAADARYVRRSSTEDVSSGRVAP